MQANRAWESIKKNLELKLSKSEFKTWFSSASPMSFEDDKGFWPKVLLTNFLSKRSSDPQSKSCSCVNFGIKLTKILLD